MSKINKFLQTQRKERINLNKPSFAEQPHVWVGGDPRQFAGWCRCECGWRTGGHCGVSVAHGVVPCESLP